MTIANIDRSRFFPLAGIAAPVTAVMIARVMLSAGPSVAPAAGLEPYDQLPPAVPTNASAPSEAQEAVIRFLATLPSDGELRSPMAKPILPERVEHPPHEPPVAEREDPCEMLVLNSIVSKGNRALASIGNKIYRIGEEPLPGWIITRIDASGRVVVLRHSDGTEAQLTYRIEELGR